MFGVLGQQYKWQSVYSLGKYLQVINQASKPLAQYFLASLLEKQAFLTIGKALLEVRILGLLGILH